MSLSRQPFFNNLLQKIAFRPNWVWRKESFLTLINLEGIFLLPMWIPSQRSQVRRFWIELSLADRIFSYFFPFGRKLQIGITIIQAKRSQRSQTKQSLTVIFFWCLKTFLDQHDVSKISVWEKECSFLLTLWNKPSQRIQRRDFGKNESGRSSRKLQILDT
jgi:hypothetical protein